MKQCLRLRYAYTLPWSGIIDQFA